ncbi:MAG: type VII secretion protein EccE [Jatrophihabitantaceae bacterium]
MPQLTRIQLVLLELAAAGAAVGLAASNTWRWVNFAAGALLAILALVPLHRRWLYQLALSWVQMVRRRSSVRGPGLQSMLGGYQIITVPAGSQGTAFGVVRSGSTWALPLELALDAVYNDDAPVPVEQLASLLRVEDVPMATVRLLTVFSPATPSSGPAGPVPAPPRLASRYCVITMDTALASDAVAARGGTEAAFNQILRRAALRCEQSLAAVGVRVRRLDDHAVTGLFQSCIGPAGTRPDGSLPPSAEDWGAVRVAGTWSTSFAVSGSGAAVADALGQVAATARTPVAVTSLVLQRSGSRADLEATLLLRLSGAGSVPDRGAIDAVAERAHTAGLVLQRLDGEQGRLLRATTPVGVGVGA